MRDRHRALHSTLWSTAGAFVLGACVTVATQSVASSTVATPAVDSNTTNETPTSAIPTAGPVRPNAASSGATVVVSSGVSSARNPPGTATIEHLARGQNAYVGRLSLVANAGVPSHRDSTEEYIHVLEGSGTMTLDGQAFKVNAGTTVYMPANAEVSFQNDDAEMVAIQVFAGPEPADKYATWTVE